MANEPIKTQKNTNELIKTQGNSIKITRTANYEELPNRNIKQASSTN